MTFQSQGESHAKTKSIEATLSENQNQGYEDNLVDNAKSIKIYDKIIKSGFSHLSIFLDDFNFIYNEVYDDVEEGEAQ